MDDIIEIWKPYEFRGLNYKVSNLGSIMGMSRNKILKQRLNEDGYKTVTLGKEKEGRTSLSVHRIVALLFVDNPNPKECVEVNHKDFDRTNCHFDNLEWTTHKINIAYTVKANRHAASDGKMCGKNNPNYNNHTLKERYKNNPELSKKNNSRPKDKNGRAKQIFMYDSNKNFVKQFRYIGECTEYLVNNHISKANKPSSIKDRVALSAKNSTIFLNYYFSFKNDEICG